MVNRRRYWIQVVGPTPQCLLCDAEGSPGSQLCRPCLTDLPWIGHACQTCAKPIESGDICGECQRTAFNFSKAFIPLRYAFPVDRMVQSLKFSGRLELARSLAALLGEVLDPQSLPQCLVPVPLHRRRLRARGFNQAAEIARHLARRTGVPLAQSLCFRCRPSVAQSSLPARARRRNVRGAFAAGNVPAGLHHVAIVDDVVTTGATVLEVARTLRRAGIEEIEVWACARTVQAGSG